MVSEELKHIFNCIEAQKNFLKEFAKKNPDNWMSNNFAKGVGFAPTNGICYRCHKQIYTGISLEDANSRFITSCPHCHTSFCE